MWPSLRKLSKLMRHMRPGRIVSADFDLMVMHGSLVSSGVLAEHDVLFPSDVYFRYPHGMIREGNMISTANPGAVA